MIEEFFAAFGFGAGVGGFGFGGSKVGVSAQLGGDNVLLGDVEILLGLFVFGFGGIEGDFGFVVDVFFVNGIELGEELIFFDGLGDVEGELGDAAGGLAFDVDVEVGDDAAGGGDGLEDVAALDGGGGGGLGGGGGGAVFGVPRV